VFALHSAVVDVASTGYAVATAITAIVDCFPFFLFHSLIGTVLSLPQAAATTSG